jgi:hypothetical protein
MSKTSRRAVLAGIAAAPALAGPALALTDTSADPQLIELGRQLGIAWGEGTAAAYRYHRLRKALDDEIDRVTNLPADKNLWSTADWGKYEAAYTASDRGAGTHYHDAHNAWNATAVRCSKLVDAIAEMPARTIAGLGAKALAVAYALDEDGAWKNGGNQYGEQEAVLLIDAIAALAGVALLPHGIRQLDYEAVS